MRQGEFRLSFNKIFRIQYNIKKDKSKIKFINKINNPNQIKKIK